MAFIATNLPLQRGFEQLCSVALQQKTYLDNWNTRLAGNITALDAMEIVASIKRALLSLDSAAALPGMQTYAQQQFGNASYDVAQEFSVMRASLQSIVNWLQTNIPANAITIVQGAPVGAIYAPAATAPLKALMIAAWNTIS